MPSPLSWVSAQGLIWWRDITLANCPLASPYMPCYMSVHMKVHTFTHINIIFTYFFISNLTVHQLEMGGTNKHSQSGCRILQHLSELDIQTYSGKRRKQKCRHVHTQGQAHMRAHKSARDIHLGTNHGNWDWGGSWPPSQQSGHLINVTQRPILLAMSFCVLFP